MEKSLEYRFKAFLTIINYFIYQILVQPRLHYATRQQQCRGNTGSSGRLQNQQSQGFPPGEMTLGSDPFCALDKGLWLIQTERKRDWEEWFAVCYAEYFTLQLMWELKQDWELNEWFTKPFSTLPGELIGNLLILATAGLS